MQMFDAIPAILRVAAVFILILFAIRKNLSLGNAFILGGLFLGLFFGMTLPAIAASILAAALDPETISLSVIVVLILVLSNSMETAGQMRRMLTKFRGMIANPHLNLIIFPALIGLLPMPGGAVFSAPMVKDLGEHSNLEPRHLSYINYWFRHIWEYWWPMYPGVLLATLMAKIDLTVYILFMLPLSAMAIYVGWRPIRSAVAGYERKKSGRRHLGSFFVELLPIVIAILPGLTLGSLLTAFLPRFSIAKETGLVAALCAAVAWIWFQNRFTGKQIRQLLVNSQMIKMLYMVFAILIFKQLLTDSDAVSLIAGELTQWAIPLFMVAALLPFIVGTITGLTVAFVGATFPIIIPLVQSHGQSDFMLAYVMLSLVFGFIGVLISPLHLCLILSNQYFKAEPSAVYQFLKWPCIGLAVMSGAYFWLLKFLAPF